MKAMINPKILILPCISGRKFYCKALCEAVDKGAEIVCLGDYLDPYPGDELHEKGVFAMGLCDSDIWPFSAGVASGPNRRSSILS